MLLLLGLRTADLRGLKNLNAREMNLFSKPLFASEVMRTVEHFDCDLSDREYIGSGMIRACYRVPGKMECVKFYRTTEAPQRKWKLDTYWRIHLTRHLFWFNINMQEWRYYERLKKRLPADLMGVFPETMTPLYSPLYGWGVKETLLLNYDGTPVRSVVKQLQAFKDISEKEALFDDVSQLVQKIIHYHVAIHDPQNILIQWISADHYQLRIVDFEPRTKAFIPGLTYIRPYLRRRITKRCTRYLRLLREGMINGFGDEED